MCRTANAGPGQKAFKQSILDTCDKRKDEIASQVRACVEGAVTDLHAADARHRTSCMSSFMSPRSVSAASNSSQVKEDVDQAFQDLLEEMENDKSCLWNQLSYMLNTSSTVGKNFLEGPFMCVFKTTS